jgi:hypothetical protein
MQKILIATVLIGLASVGCDNAQTPAPPAADKPAEKPADKPASAAADKPADTPPATPANAAAEKPAGGDDKAEADAPAGGQVIKNDTYKLKFTLPKDWVVTKSDTAVTAESADKGIFAIVAGSKSQDVAQASLANLKSNLTFKDLNIEKQGTATFGGLVGLRGEGDATLVKEDKSEQNIHFVAFSSKVDDQAVTVVIFSSKERYTKDIDTIEGILETLDKL